MDDYCIRYINLPCSVHGMTVRDATGFFNIYININIGIEEQKKAIRHELMHVLRGDFDREDEPLGRVEAM